MVIYIANIWPDMYVWNFIQIQNICRCLRWMENGLKEPKKSQGVSVKHKEFWRMERKEYAIAIIIVAIKFKAFLEYELMDISGIVSYYTEQLKDVDGLAVPIVPEGYSSSWAQYTLRLSETVERAAVQSNMRECGIPTMVYYGKPMHTQGAFTGTRSAVADCPNTGMLCGCVLCLPIHPYLTKGEIELVADTLKGAFYFTKGFES